MVHYKLTYFNARAKAEIIRLIFAVADENYEDVRIELDQWSKLKPTIKTPFGKLPTFEIDGKLFCQSYAIGRYMARKFKLAGKTDLEQLQVDMIVACTEDGLNPVVDILHEEDETRKAQMKKKYSEEQLPAAYASLENILKSNKGGDGFLVGEELTWADLAFLVFSDWAKFGGYGAILEKYPKLEALTKRVESVPRVAAWIAKRPVTIY